MKNQIKTIVIIQFILLLFWACTDDDMISDNVIYRNVHLKNSIININTTRSCGNILSCNTTFFKPQKQRRNILDDSFTTIREVETFESVILPELQSHIWLGNVLTRNSVANCIYKPLSCTKRSIMVSTTLPNSYAERIVTPSYSSTMKYIKDQISNSKFTQNDEFELSVEQFTSYNELKSSFGSNVNTNFLFWGSSSSDAQTEHHISKATGLYIKFFQTSFKAVMDYPELPYTNLSNDIIDSAVYVNSITYGRLGIMSLETNMSADYAKKTISNSFHKLFVNGSNELTKEEQDFLNGCDFKLYLIGGEGASAVQTFTGFSGFVDHIKKGTFTKESPGVPVFCTFNNVYDNSQACIKFIYNIKREPLYIELLLTDKKGNDMNCLGTITAKFYNSRSRVPAIAPPNMPILVEHSFFYFKDGKTALGRDTIERVSQLKFYNSSQNTSQVLLQNTILQRINPTRFVNNPRDPHFEYGDRERSSYRLLEGSDYIPLNTNIINHLSEIDNE